MTDFSVQELELLLKTRSVSEINDDFISKISCLAARFAKEYLQKPIILLCGPSGSGKTTSAKLLEHFLDSSGYEAHTVSLDNYFKTVSEMTSPRTENGEIDLESPECVDMPLLRSHLRNLADCVPVDVPVFDFPTRSRSEKTVRLARKSGEILIFEGIHALNPGVLQGGSYAQKLFVGVNTSVFCENAVLTPEKIRLLRRLLRDRTHRAQSFEQTIARFSEVSRGERLFVNPTLKNADFELDTFCPFELSVYRDLLLPDLKAFSLSYLRENGLCDTITVLESLSPIDAKNVPETSIINEFLY